MFCKNLVLDYLWPTAVPEITSVSATHTASATVCRVLWGHCGSMERIVRKQVTIPYSWEPYTLVVETVLVHVKAS